MLVTVLMSAYNSDRYIEKAIDSILNQTLKEFEFIICDDGSTDRTLNIILKYASNDARITLIRNEVNIGLAKSLNRGILLAKGQYIARQDADDWSSPDRLRIQLEYALKNGNVDVIGSDCYVTDIFDEIIYEETKYSKNHRINNNSLNKVLLPHGSALLKKETLINSGLYDPRFFYVQDRELWIRLLCDGAQAHVIAEPLYFYRAKPVSNSKQINSKRLYNRAIDMLYFQQNNTEIVHEELKKIQAYLSGENIKPLKYHMAVYWKKLANASYIQNCSKYVTYKYLYRAIREKNSIISYPRYLLLALIYLIPSTLFKKSLMLSRRFKVSENNSYYTH